MKCPKCFRENPPGAAYCKGCGVKLPGFDIPMQKVQNKTQIVQNSSGSIRSNPKEILIGRSSTCDIAINDPGVSSKHAKIYEENGKIYIDDLRSLNGTIVNGRKISSHHLLHSNDDVNLGNYRLNMQHNYILDLFSKFGDDGYSFDSGTLKLKINSNWLGKIFFFLMIILFFLPWLTIKSTEGSISFTAFDFAFNRFPSELGILKQLTNPDYGPLHTLFIILFLGLIVGMIFNFFNFKISDKFNYVNILSIILLVLAVVYMYLVSSVDKLLGFAPVMMQHNFAPYGFLFICLISIFEGLFEFFIGERRKYSV